MEHTIQLTVGYTDKTGVTHRGPVTFGKRLTVRDLIALDNDPLAQNPTQYMDLITRRMITKFGELKTPVALSVLLSLNSVDREDLAMASDKFLQLTRPEPPADGEVFRKDHVVQLRFGFDIEGTKFTFCQFGKLTTGKDEVDADTLKLTGVARACFMIGKQITALWTEDENVRLEQSVPLDLFNDLDGEDLNLLRNGSSLWALSFRLRGTGVSRVGNGKDSVSADEGDRHVSRSSVESSTAEGKQLPKGKKGTV